MMSLSITTCSDSLNESESLFSLAAEAADDATNSLADCDRCASP